MPRIVTNLRFDGDAEEASRLGALLGDADPARARPAFEMMFPMAKIDLATIEAAADA